MFNYMFKSLPEQYVFAGYNVRRGLTVMTTNTDNGIVYDIFLYTYLDNNVSFYLLMEDGTYKNVELKENLPVMSEQDIVSKHLFRGAYYDIKEYGEYDKDKVIGVYGLRSMTDLMKQVDEMEKDSDSHEMSMQALLDFKTAYTGMEITGAINRFNRDLKRKASVFTVPALKKDENDTYESVIGDINAWNAFIENKTPDQIINDLLKLDENNSNVSESGQDNLNDMLMRR